MDFYLKRGLNMLYYWGLIFQQNKTFRGLTGKFLGKMMISHYLKSMEQNISSLKICIEENKESKETNCAICKTKNKFALCQLNLSSFP